MSFRSRSVLIAEGNRKIALEHRHRLEQAGFRVFVATDGEQACILAARQRFHLIVANLVLPIVSGAEFCRHIREDLQLADVPIAIYAPAGTESDASDIADDYNIARVFSQPVDLESLVEFATETSGQLVAA